MTVQPVRRARRPAGDGRRPARASTSTSRSTCRSGHLRPRAGPRPRRRARRRRPPDRAAAHPGRPLRRSTPRSLDEPARPRRRPTGGRHTAAPARRRGAGAASRARGDGGGGRPPSATASASRRGPTADAVAAIDPDGRLVAVLDGRAYGSAKVVFAEPRHAGRRPRARALGRPLRRGHYEWSAVQRWYGLARHPGRLRAHRRHARQLRRGPPRPPGGPGRASCAQARAIGALAVAVTFEPHPIAVLLPRARPAAHHRPGHRLDACWRRPASDAVLVIEFTREFAQLTPEEFVRTVFVEALGARAVVVGKDTRFGVRNSGDVGTLRELGRDARLRGPRPGRPRRGRRRAGPPAGSRQLVAAGDVDARRGDPRPPAPGHPAPSCTATTAAASWATRPPTWARSPPAWCPPTASMPAGCCGPGCHRTTPTAPCRPRSRSAPTRPSTAPSAGSRPTSWTAPTSTSTASDVVAGVRSSGCAPPSATTRSRRCCRRWRRTSSSCRRVLSSIVPS